MSNQPALSVPPTDLPNWWQALTISERSAGASPLHSPDERTARRLQEWRNETAFLKDEAFVAHLETEGLSEATLANLLGESAEALRARRGEPLPWLSTLYAAYGRDEADTLFTDDQLAEAGFLVLVEPLLLWARDDLRHQLTALLNVPNAPFSFEVAQAALFDALLQQLPPLIDRTLVLELNVARLQGVLVGETATERFRSFLNRLREPAVAWALFEEYPVLARHLVTKVQQSSAALVEILTHLVADWPALSANFANRADPGLLVELEIGAGDTHRDGRAVAILRFANGLRLVYKPRSLAVDVQFQTLLTWLNQRGAQPAFRTLTVLDRHIYGWIEFVTAAPCTTRAEITRFYTRQGGYLALLHLLSAADFHFENLIASGEHPLLIDLEALFHPDIMEYDPTNPGELAQQALDQSVLSIGMLPQRLRFHAAAATIDISGLGAAGTQLTPDKLPVWEGVGTDEMHLTRRHVEFSSAGHRPTLAGAEIDVRAYGGAVAEGFAQIYRLLLTHRAAFMAAAGPLAGFADVEIRVVARATRTYSLLLQESSHPDMLRNALDRDRLYERLWRDVATSPRLARLIHAERRDLHNGDVPIFLAKPATRHLWDSQGEEIAEFLPESGLARVTRRLDAMGEADLARQLWYIRASFAAIDGTNSHRQSAEMAGSQNEIASPTTVAAASPVQLLAEARAIGDQLAGLAHRYQEHAVWIGLGLDEHDTWSLAPLTMHLYDGHAGMALFFAYLGTVTGEARYRTLAEAALATTLVQAEGLTHFHAIGGFSGWGGLIYTLTNLGALWQRPDLWAKALHFAERAIAHVAQDEQFDIIGGAAGCIGAAAVLYAETQDAIALRLVDLCADHLCTHAQPMATGVGWVVPNMGGAPLAGFSHGAAGIAWALFKAVAICNKERYRTIAEEALRYERSLYDPAAENWLDLRSDGTEPTDEGEPQFMWAWCHGAPGIGLARLAMDPAHADAQMQAEIMAALRSTRLQGFGGGHSLCHGDLGNLDLLLTAAVNRSDQALLLEVYQAAANILTDGATHGWRCGVPGAVETPGLMVGLAGIGYELLRLASPAAVPSILLLEGPRS